MTKRSATNPLPTKPAHGQSVQISRDPDQARTHQKRRSAALQRTHKSQISIAPALDPAGSFFGDFRTPAGVRNSSRKQTGGFGDIDPGKLPFVHYLSDRSFPLRLLYARHYRLLPMDIMSHRSIRHRHHPGHPQAAARRRHIRHNEHVRHHSTVLVIQDVAVHHELADVAVIS
jgi:hypothetical protein